MKKIILVDLKNILEKIDGLRDKLLFLFIKPYWPRKIMPNHITYVRVVIGILLFVLLFFFEIENKTLIVSLFFVGMLTDLFDGSVARGTNRVTEFGAMLDSTADRILIIPIAFYSLFKIHKWLLLVLVIVEIINALSSMYYKSKEIYLESNIFGKTKMVLQSVVFVVILISWPNAPSQFFISILWSTIIFTFLSIFLMISELKLKTVNLKIFFKKKSQ